MQVLSQHLVQNIKLKKNPISNLSVKLYRHDWLRDVKFLVLYILDVN